MSSSTPQVEPYRPEYFDTVFQSVTDAFRNDPFSEYLSEGQEEKGAMKRWRKKLWKERTEQDNKTNLINVINGGDAVIKVIPPSSGVKVPGPIDRLRSKLITFAMMGYLILRSWEQLKRSLEADDKMTGIQKEKFGGSVGDKNFDYFYVGLLATAPKHQGQGYGSALMDFILFQADLKGRQTFLFSSTPDNVPFYESFGFEVIGEIKLGENNSKWKKSPVIVPLMLRKPQTKS